MKQNASICKVIAFFILSAVALAACTAYTAPSNTSEVTSTSIASPRPTVDATPTLSVRARWLQGVPCAPPCWEGITPGISTFTETLTIISTIPGILDMKVIHLKQTIGVVATWRMAGERAGIQEHIIDISSAPLEQGGLVTSMFMGLPPMTLADVISSYGPPSHLQIVIEPQSGSPQAWRIRLLWLSQGFEMSMLGSGEVPSINERFRVGQRITYFPPGAEGYQFINGIEFREENFVPWAGYGEYEDKAFIVE